jgi:hypothetical protein
MDVYRQLELSPSYVGHLAITQYDYHYSLLRGMCTNPALYTNRAKSNMAYVFMYCLFNFILKWWVIVV